MATTNLCKSYVDFLNVSALKYLEVHDRAYTNDICVYALSAKRDINDNTKIDSYAFNNITKARLNFAWPISWNYNIRFVKSNSAEFMCYKFKLSDITTESDTEPDVPYSYEELFNENVLNHLYSSTGMQYKYIYSAYKSFTSQYISEIGKYTKDLMLNNFKTTNNLVSDENFVRSDYYKFFVPETDVVHSRSILELNDDALASVGNTTHESFNCLLYCVNPNFDSYLSAGTDDVPKGFLNTDFKAIPVSLCTYSKDIILAGNNVQFEPNLNGIVTVE